MAPNVEAKKAASAIWEADATPIYSLLTLGESHEFSCIH